MKYSYRTFSLEAGAWLFALIMSYPVFLVINSSLKSFQELSASPFSLVKSITFEHYARVIGEAKIVLSFSNSIFVTAVIIAASIVLSSMMSFAIHLNNGRLGKIVFFILISSIMIPGLLGMIPLYKLASTLGLTNTYVGYCLITTSGQLPFLVFLYTGFLGTVGKEIMESASIDGCSVYQLFVRIVFPLLKPITATAVILLTLGIWNDFLGPLLYLQDASKQTVILMLYNYVSFYTKDWASIFPLIVLIMLPNLIAYLSLQSYIIKGIASGAIKG
ncbi:carbohydrate ABC transporter permease [Paenibacillus sp. GCM10027626]|uniref:carbohydrate ABC transporter permease n=1 Tax=Paenibacillus sp. GCM10027626 TaxID=3273411 RepID=UPI003627FFA5